MSDIAKQIVNVPFLTSQVNYAEWSTAVENLALLGDCWDQMTGEDEPYDDSVAEKAKFHGHYNKAKGLIVRATLLFGSQRAVSVCLHYPIPVGHCQ